MEKRKEKLILIWISHFITSFKELEVGTELPGSNYPRKKTQERKPFRILDIDIWHLFGQTTFGDHFA